ncbi:hypothetical protein [Desulfatibacillum alkenivorans]|jgi:hypothetical protein|nr:hypothetical protein [Desulfatibacillum alkenivorans]
MERLALMVADTESKGGCYDLPENASLFEIAMVLQETAHPLKVLSVHDPEHLKDRDLATIVRIRTMLSPTSWVHDLLVEKIIGNADPIPPLMGKVLDAINSEDVDFLREVIINPVTTPDFIGFDLWAQRLAVRHMVEAFGGDAIMPFEPKVRPALAFYAGLALGQQDRNRLAASMEKVSGMPDVDDVELEEFANLLKGE